MPLNLVQHRGEPSVWDRTDQGTQWDAERWLIAVMAGAFFVSGFRRRSMPGLMLALGGSALAWWAAAGADERRGHRDRLREVASRVRRAELDLIHESSEESFPASDAPSWTTPGSNRSGATAPTH